MQLSVPLRTAVTIAALCAAVWAGNHATGVTAGEAHRSLSSTSPGNW